MSEEPEISEISEFDKNRHTDIMNYLRSNPFGKELRVELNKPKTIVRWILMGILMWGVSTELGYFSWASCTIGLLILSNELDSLCLSANIRLTKKTSRFLAYHFSVSEYTD